jgi:hypothetical protein
MNITPYTVISIETLLFGSDNLTDEHNLIVFRNVQKYIHFTHRFGWYEIILCTQDAIIHLGHPQEQLGSLTIFALNKSAPSELHRCLNLVCIILHFLLPNI